jgi:hypothetical protein
MVDSTVLTSGLSYLLRESARMQAMSAPCHVCLLVSVGLHVSDSPACHRAVSQVSSRAVTFGLNLIITRLLTPETYGVRNTALCTLHARHSLCDPVLPLQSSHFDYLHHRSSLPSSFI